MPDEPTNILAIDTSTSYLNLAISFGGDRMVQSTNDVGRMQGQVILKKIEELFESAELTVSQIGAIAVCVGPGSFTGLRVGLAVAKGIAEVVGAKAVGVSLFEMANEHLHEPDAKCWIVAPSRREEVYLTRVEAGQVVAESIQVCADNEVVAVVGQDEVYAVGLELASRFPELRTGRNGGSLRPTAADLLRVATTRVVRGEFDDLVELEPLYLQKAIAEIRFDRRHGTDSQ